MQHGQQHEMMLQDKESFPKPLARVHPSKTRSRQEGAFGFPPRQESNHERDARGRQAADMYMEEMDLHEEASITSKDATKHMLFNQPAKGILKRRPNRFEEAHHQRMNQEDETHDFFGIAISR